MEDLLNLANRDSSDKMTLEQLIEALEGLKTKGVIDYSVETDGSVKIEMIAPELMFGKPTYH